MARMLDPSDTLAALTELLTRADVTVVGNVVGELRPPCVQIMPPALAIDENGEGWDVLASSFSLLAWYSGTSGALDTVGELTFALQVLEALRAPSRFASFVPSDAGEPSVEQVGGDGESDQRHMFRRVIPLTIYHAHTN